MKFGKFEVELFQLGRFRMDGGGLFGVVPKVLWSRVYPHSDDLNRVQLVTQALLVRGEGITLVADAGLGDKLDEKTRSIFAVEQEPDALVRGLAARGIAPEDVTHFVYTHLHFDHAGGATRLGETGAAVPVFPQARHLVQAAQLAWANSPSDKDKASYNPANWIPVATAGLLDEIDGHHEIAPGLELRPVHGHTTGLQMVMVRGSGPGGANGFLFTIDLFPTAAHLPPHYIAGFDNYPLTVLEEKKQILAEAETNRWVLGFGHDPFTKMGMVEKAARGYTLAWMGA